MQTSDVLIKTRLFFWISIIIISISCWSGCECDPLEDFDRALCTYRDSITAPPGYSIKFIDTLPQSGNIRLLRFVDDQTGYALASGKYGYVDVLKTVDGGYHWIDLKVDYNNYARSLAFISADTGVITLHDVTGCPNQCQNICAILRTTDGGIHWTKHEIQNFRGIIGDLANDQKGHFFGILANNNMETLVWSNDKGITWDTFPNLGTTLEDVKDLQVFEDNIYVVTKGELFVIDQEGQILRTMSIPESNIDLKIIGEDHFILTTFDSVTVTLDGFQTTHTLIKEQAHLIGYKDLYHVVAIINKSFCPTDVWQSNDLFAYTDDGGQTWTEGQLKTNLILELRACHKVNDDQYILILYKGVFELKKI